MLLLRKIGPLSIFGLMLIKNSSFVKKTTSQYLFVPEKVPSFVKK